VSNPRKRSKCLFGFCQCVSDRDFSGISNAASDKSSDIKKKYTTRTGGLGRSDYDERVTRVRTPPDETGLEGFRVAVAGGGAMFAALSNITFIRVRGDYGNSVSPPYITRTYTDAHTQTHTRRERERGEESLAVHRA